MSEFIDEFTKLLEEDVHAAVTPKAREQAPPAVEGEDEDDAPSSRFVVSDDEMDAWVKSAEENRKKKEEQP